MEKKRLVGIALVCCVLFMTTICFAETYSQKDELFKIDVPNGWHWVEKPSNIRITNPEGTNGISIQFKPTSIETDEEIKEILKLGVQNAIKLEVEPYNGTVISDRESEIDGVYARQLDYLLILKGETGQITSISFINKGYAFAISFGGPFKKERVKMQKIVETFQFQ